MKHCYELLLFCLCQDEFKTGGSLPENSGLLPLIRADRVSCCPKNKGAQASQGVSVRSTGVSSRADVEPDCVERRQSVSLDQSNYVPPLSDGHELWVAIK